MNGAERIAAERRRQLDAEGWTPEHDDEHDSAELGRAAAAYIWFAAGQVNGVCWPDDHDEPVSWPWERSWWKPSGDPVRNLEKAGALIAAEIDRLLRARHPSATNGTYEFIEAFVPQHVKDVHRYVARAVGSLEGRCLAERPAARGVWVCTLPEGHAGEHGRPPHTEERP